ncbi:DDE-type integrase/transposase/recombinase [Tetragenococcus koreensis]|uniref:DDE-type integrase/transposase/recombinase n=1 Tax=Tetragenococcus koreensis TaxID=290335 RepID=UPI002E194EBF
MLIQRFLYDFNQPKMGRSYHLYPYKKRGGGWTYLASVMDLYSRKINGYSYGKQMTISIVVDAFHQAVQNQQLKEGQGLILQTDLGVQ